jgi:hypothetical protein
MPKFYVLPFDNYHNNYHLTFLQQFYYMIIIIILFHHLIIHLIFYVFNVHLHLNHYLYQLLLLYVVLNNFRIYLFVFYLYHDLLYRFYILFFFISVFGFYPTGRLFYLCNLLLCHSWLFRLNIFFYTFLMACNHLEVQKSISFSYNLKLSQFFIDVMHLFYEFNVYLFYDHLCHKLAKG